jgi:hypothetical protein
MVEIVGSDGSPVIVPDEAITVITGPYAFEPVTKSYIRGAFGQGALESTEDPAHLVGRLQVKEPLVQLTRPNGTPVWVKPSAISILRYPNDMEARDEPGYAVRSVIIVGGYHQPLREDIAAVQRIMVEVPAVVATAAASARKFGKLSKEIFTTEKSKAKAKPRKPQKKKRAARPRNARHRGKIASR